MARAHAPRPKRREELRCTTRHLFSTACANLGHIWSIKVFAVDPSCLGCTTCVFLIVYMSYSSLLKSLWVVHALLLVACWIYVLANTYTPAFSLQAPPLPPCHITTGILSQCHAHVDVDKMHVLTNSKGVYIRNMYEYYLCSS